MCKFQIASIPRNANVTMYIDTTIHGKVKSLILTGGTKLTQMTIWYVCGVCRRMIIQLNVNYTIRI